MPGLPRAAAHEEVTGSSRALPPVVVTMPDGQAVQGRLHERRQTEDD